MKKSLIALLALVLLVTVPAPSLSDPQPDKPQPYTRSENKADLFEQVFGYKRKLPDRLLIPFLIGSRQFGKIELFLTEEGKRIQVKAAMVLEQLAPFLQTSIIEKLRIQVDDLNRLEMMVLLQAGLKARFDESSLTFRIDIPPELRRTRIFGLEADRLPPNYEYAIAPNELSAFVNIRAGLDYYHGRPSVGPKPRNTLAVNFDAAVNYKNIVTEGIFQFSADSRWSLEYARLVYDQPEKMRRYSMGDLIIPVRGFQSAPALGGIGISKDFSLQPYLKIRPFSSWEVFISRPSTVEVFVNGVLIETLHVQPGPYNFYQTALNHGINNVKIRIRNDLGDEEWIDTDVFYSGAGLKKGLAQYSFNLGFLRGENRQRRDYDPKRYISSLFYRAGVSNNQTLGGYFQNMRGRLLFGIEDDYSSVFGNVNSNLAISKNRNDVLDFAVRVIYYYFNNNLETNPYLRSWKASVEYRGRRFVHITQEKPDNPNSWILTGSVGQNLSNTVYGSLGASYGFARPGSGRADSYSLSAFLKKRLTSLARLTFNVTNRRLAHRKDDEWMASVNLTIHVPDKGHSINATYATNDNGVGLNWQYRPPRSRVTNMLTVRSSDGAGLNFSERLAYAGYRGNVSLTHFHDEPEKGEASSRTNLALGTALVFVGGHFGWTRTVNNSFAIINPNDVLKDFTIGLNRRQDGSFQSVRDFFGPAAKTDLMPYQLYDLRIEIPDLPPGYEVDGFDYTLLPSYKSGFLLDVIGKAFVLVRGRLVDKQNNPLKYAVGNALSLDEPTEAIRSFFTNKNGSFTIYGMTPGRYELRLSAGPWKTMIIEIPKNCVSNYCKLGTIVVESVDPDSETRQESVSKTPVPVRPIIDTIVEESVDPDSETRQESVSKTPVPAQPVRGIITGSKVHLRSGPSLRAPVLHRIEDKGTGVEVLGKQGDWFKVKVLDFEGWVFKKYIRLRQYQAPDGK